MHRLENEEASGKEKKSYMMLRNLLYYVSKEEPPTLKLMVPISLQSLVLQAYHEGMVHMASQRCYEAIAAKYHWKGIFKDVMQHCLVDCKICHEENMKPEVPALQETLRPNLPWQIMSLDLVGPFEESFDGNKWILTMIDLFTAWPEAICIPNKEAATIAATFLEHIWPRFGSPLILVSDREATICSKVVNHVFNHLKTGRIVTSPYSPQSNYVERFHSYLNSHLRKSIRHKDIRMWDTLVPPCLASYRFSSHNTNGHSPYFAMHGYDPTLPLDTLLRPRRKYLGSDHSQIYLENLHNAFSHMARRAKESRHKNRQRHEKKVTQ